MKLIERIKPEIMEVVKYKLPLFLEEWLEKEITPIELPIGLARVLYSEAYGGPFDYGKYLRMFEEPVINMTLEEAVDKGLNSLLRKAVNTNEGTCCLSEFFKSTDKK
jgi:hypothetical protein